jgi:glycosyltransferase involved in cell wall biosynthesis
VFRGLTVAVVVPAFNEADKIQATVGSVPGFVDHVIVVDDGSSDRTGIRAGEVARPSANPRRLEVVAHAENRGVGAAIATGYARAVDRGVDVVAVMAGDGQMDPGDLAGLLAPVADGTADYVKGNRFAWPGGWRHFPPVRLGGSIALSWLTRLATGYRHVFDSQCGYTAISRRALLAVAADRMYPRYGYQNDLLARLAKVGARVIDVPVRPVYGGSWRSGLRPWRVAVPLSRILLRAFAQRIERRRSSPPCLPPEQPPCASGC